jgi:hypothetical protein
MAEQRTPSAGWSDDELVRALGELGQQVVFTPTPDLTLAVRSATARPPETVRARVRGFPVRRLLAAVAIVLLALVAGLVLSGGFRSTVADWFGGRGVRIVIERETPTATAPTPSPSPNVGTGGMAATPVGTGLLLGRRVTLSEARAAVPYELRVPTLASLGEPDEIYLRTLPDGNRMVAFIYLPAPGLPETLETGVGALLMQFAARDDVMYIGKELADGNVIDSVEVNGGRGMWIGGSHQLTLFTDPSQGCCDVQSRPAGNVLIWEQDGVVFRLESALSEEQALAIARSVAVPKATPGAGNGI